MKKAVFSNAAEKAAGKENMRYIFQSFNQIFNRHQKTRMCILLCMMVIGAILETAGVTLIFPFVSLVLDSNSVFENRIMFAIYKALGIQSSRDFLILVSVGLIGIFVFKNVYLYFMYSIQYRFASNNKLQMSSKLFSIYLNKPYEFYLSKNASEIIRNVNTDVANVFTLLTTILQMLTEIITAFGLLAILMAIDFYMTLFVTILLLMAIVAMKYIFKPIQRITGVQARNSDAEIIKWLNQSVHGIKEVKITESESFFFDHYYKCGQISAEASRKFNVINTVPQLFIELVFMVGIICYIIFLLISGADVSNLVPQISAFAMAAIRLLPIANRLNRYLGVITYSIPSLESVKNELSMESKAGVGNSKTEKPIERKLVHKIQFDNVSFRYDNSCKLNCTL